MAKVRQKQSIYDLTTQGFGQIDELIKFAKDNNLSLNEDLTVNEDVVFNNPIGVGNDRNKESIELQQLTFNNDFITTGEGIGFFIIGDNFIIS